MGFHLKALAIGATALVAAGAVAGCSSTSTNTPAPSDSATRSASGPTYGTQLTVINKSSVPLEVELFDGDSGDYKSKATAFKKVTLKKGESVVGAGEAEFNGSTCDISANVTAVGSEEGADIYSAALPSLNGSLYFGENEGVGCTPSRHNLIRPYQVGQSHSGDSMQGVAYTAKRLNETGDSLGNMQLTFTDY